MNRNPIVMTETPAAEPVRCWFCVTAAEYLWRPPFAQFATCGDHYSAAVAAIDRLPGRVSRYTKAVAARLGEEERSFPTSPPLTDLLDGDCERDAAV